MEVTYREFFEKAKEEPRLQKLVTECFLASIKVTLVSKKAFPKRPQIDAGELMLSGLATLANLEGIVLTNRDEITAEYMANILNTCGRF